MPLYEYTCTKCEAQFEVLIRKPPDEKILTCPKCNSKDITKLFSTFGMAGLEKGGASSPNSFGNSSASACGSCRSGTCATCH